MIFVPGDGPSNARIMIVGEAPGEQEEYQGKPFVGSSGGELAKELHEAGIIKRDCFLTNVSKVRPPGNEIEEFFYQTKTEAKENFAEEVWGRHPKDVIKWGLADLWADVNEVRPQLIIALGGTALWACTGRTSITNWRGSVMESLHFGEAGRIKVVPTYHPAAVNRMWSWRNIAVHDLKRARAESEYPEIRRPQWRFLIAPTADQVMETLAVLIEQAENKELWLACDIETRHHSYIDCIGIGWSKLDALCIPLVRRDGSGYFDLDTEVIILHTLMQLLTHKNVRVIGQNFHYDSQYFAKEFGYVPRIGFDTQLAQHTLWAGLPKRLSFQASMYCDWYCYWKDDGKDTDGKDTDLKQPDEKRWFYNCEDIVYTYECFEVENQLLDEMNQRPQFNFLMRQFHPVLKMMLRGVRTDVAQRPKFLGECINAMADREFALQEMLGHTINPRSPKQLMTLFYEDFGVRPILHPKTRRPTCDDDALDAIAAREPLLKDVCLAINEFRSIGQFAGVLKAKTDPDGRMRCSYDTAKVETYRYSSSKSVYDTGTNMQNLSTGERSETLKALPNIKKLILADPGCVMCEVDLAGADAQVVAWEAGDEYLKDAFRRGYKIHVVNAKDMFGASAGPDGKAEPYYTYAKQGVHLTNYGGSARRLSITLGITMFEAERFQKKWFSMHPLIPAWHKRVEFEIQTTRRVTNKFGFRRDYFDRVSSILTEALAWTPQSTVAITINHGLVNLDEQLPEVTLLLQVHDSLVFQVHHSIFPAILPRIRPLLLTPIPYPDPLTIQCGLKCSDQNWGACEPYTWPD